MVGETNFVMEIEPQVKSIGIDIDSQVEPVDIGMEVEPVGIGMEVEPFG